MSKKIKENNGSTTAEMLGLTEEEYTEKLLYYAKNQKEFEHQKRKKEYEDEQKSFADYITKTLYVAKFLKENGYEIFDLHQANEDFRKVLKLDEIKEIAGVYQTCKIYKGKKQLKEHIVPIKKQNFYNAFYQPIWVNMTLSEKVKSLEWMFETINEERNLGIKGIKYIPDDLSIASSCGYFRADDKFLYINLDYLEISNSYIKVPHTLAHELMHARQAKYAKTYNFDHQIDFYTLSQTEFNKADYENLSLEYAIDYATEIALYNTSLSEKVADLQALKTLKKYIDINNKQFGISKRLTNNFKNHMHGQLFKETNQRKTGKRLLFEPVDAIITNEEIILKGQSEFLLKLLLLKSFYENELSSINTSQKLSNEALSKLDEDFNNNKISKEKYLTNKESELKDLETYKKYIQDDYKKLDLIKKAFNETLKSGKKPKYFNETEEFKTLKLIEEPKQKYSLPRWLHQEEDKNRKNIERQKKKFGLDVEIL